MKYIVVLPSIYQPYTDACLDSMAPEFRDATLVVDNTTHNRGVSASWNLGIDQMLTTGAQWLVLLSAAIRFGNPGGLDFAAELKAPAIAVEALGVFGWHLIAFSRELLIKVGRFDEELYPGYYNDIDYSWRIQLAYNKYQQEETIWEKVKVDVQDMGMAHALQFGKVTGDHEQQNIEYMKRKWGVTSNPTRKVPFDATS